jgi:hypothetical protein
LTNSLPAQPVPQALLAPKVPLVQQGLSVKRVQRVPKVQQGPPAQQEPQVQRALKGPQVRKVQRALKGPQVLKVPLVQQEQLGLLVLQANPVSFNTHSAVRQTLER